MAKNTAPKQPQYSGKRRTRDHVIADLSLAHVQYFVANAGFSGEAITKDYGYDLSVVTFDRDGLLEPLAILIQLKASEQLTASRDGTSFNFDLDVRDYNQWSREINPVFLILYEACSIRAYWLYFQNYVSQAGVRKPKKGAKRVRIKIPRENRVKTSFFRYARHLKEKVYDKVTAAGANLHG